MISAPRYSVTVFCSVLLAATFLFTGCNREGQLEGEVFIVTRGGENIKLGLVEVQAIAEEDIKDFVLQKTRIAQDSLAKWNPIVEAAESRADSARAVVDSLESVADSLRKTDRWWASSDYDDVLDKMAVARENVVELNSAVPRSTRARWNNPPFFFEDLPEPVVTTQTNSDGEFTLPLKRNERYAVVAKAERDAGQRFLGIPVPEKYYWMIWTTLEGEPTKQLLLSNDNLVRSESENGLLNDITFYKPLN